MFGWWMVAGLVAVCALAADWLHSRRARRLLANLPSYPRLPLLGNLFKITGGPQIIYKRLVEVSDIADDAGLPFAAWIGPSPVIVLTQPEEVKLASNAFVEKPYYYRFGKVWLGDGLVLAPGVIWKQTIKKIAGTFNNSTVEGFQDVFNVQAQRLVEQLILEAGRGPFDVMEKYLSYTTLETICQTALGVPEGSDGIVTSRYYNAFQRATELLMQRGVNLLHHIDLIYSWSSSCKQMQQCVAILHDVSESVIKRRKKERLNMKKSQNGGSKAEQDTKNKRPAFKAFLDVILDMQELDPTWTESQIRGEVDTIILGGHETVATTLFYILYMLGRHQAVQDKLYAEMIAVFGDSGRIPDPADLTRLEYCEAVVLETLRLYPPFPLVLRYADHDLTIESCTIPAGTTVAINALGAGRSRRTWGKTAREFYPERWLQGTPAAGGFLPFSYGRRACIGKKYAINFLKTVLAQCVRHLKFTSREELELKIDILLKPHSGHLIETCLRK